MRGKQTKKSTRLNSIDSNDNYQLNEQNKTQGEANHTTKNKKVKKNWRFAYDLYCKEIICSSNNGGAQGKPQEVQTSKSKSKEKHNGSFMNL